MMDPNVDISSTEDDSIEEIGLPNPRSSSTIEDKKKSKRATKQKREAAKRKSMKPRSNVWKHFIKFEDEKGNKKAKCKYCGKEYAADPKSNGTSSALAHTRSCSLNPEVQSKSQQSLLYGRTNEGEGVFGCWKFDEEAIRKAVCFMIVVDELPFKFVENEGFRHMMSVACPRFRIPSRHTIARNCFDLYSDEKNKLKAYFKSSFQRVCLTTDSWTSIQRVNYMCLTAHYIDDNWKLQKKILNFCPITSHKGEAIGMTIENCLREWEIERVSTITIDNASSNDVAVEYLKKVIVGWGTGITKCKSIHMRCIAYIVNLIVHDGLKEFHLSVARVRDAVRYIRQSPARLANFRNCAQFERIESKALLCLDVSTRWNSTFLMLDAAQKFERAFSRYRLYDPNYIIELVENNGVPTEEDWKNVRSLVSFLKSFYELTCRISGSLYVTANKFFHEISEVDGLLQQWQSSEDVIFASMAKRMREKYEKYWGNIEEMNMLIYVAVVLDPQYKLAFLEFALEDMYAKKTDVGANMKIKVKSTIFELFE